MVESVEQFLVSFQELARGDPLPEPGRVALAGRAGHRHRSDGPRQGRPALDFADSALHAPAAGFGDEDFYPDLIDQAAVSTCRLGMEPPASGRQQRAAWASLVMFLDLNDCSWEPDPPNVDEAEAPCLPWRRTMSMKAGSPPGWAIACESRVTGGNPPGAPWRGDAEQSGEPTLSG
ncbi:MAG: hypothetical protein KY443_09030 [Actinobacteria bacterium]|nr:hypothetical protein [Actinomycetota bacterium]